MARFDDLTPAESEFILPHLRVAASAWFEEGTPNFDPTTSNNRFVMLAEGAYYEVLSRYEALKTRPEAPRGTIERFWLYRLFDIHHRLLYVGITSNPKARLKRHRKRFKEVLDHWTLDEFGDYSEVLNAEAVAIDAEQPAFNAQHPGV